MTKFGCLKENGMFDIEIHEQLKNEGDKEKLLKISAYSPRAGYRVILYFSSVEEAIELNPGLCDFEIIGEGIFSWSK